MVPHYVKEKGTKVTMGLWCKLDIIGYANCSFFIKECQQRDNPDKCDHQDYFYIQIN